MPYKDSSKYKAYQDEYRQKNKERLKEKNKRWREANAEVIKRKKQAYHQSKKHGIEYRLRRAENSRRHANKVTANRAYHKARYHEHMQWLDDIKARSGCIKCGEKDIRCLEFHHRDRSQKVAGVTALCGWGWKRLADEVAKCDVLCANCHCKAHADEKHRWHSLGKRRQKAPLLPCFREEDGSDNQQIESENATCLDG